MNTNRYCPDCGGAIEPEYGKAQYVCPCCGEEYTLKELVPGWVKEARINQLKAMHTIMCNTNDEGLYLAWAANGVPDCPSEDDYESIALDKEAYDECFDLFVKLVQKKGIRW